MRATDKKVDDRNVIIWLWAILVMVALMVVIGGVTRLTHSGLSMADWRPLMGTIPPLTEADWIETFAKYQETPQYKLVNKNMTIAEFKGIFFWEYIHRLWGRLIGLVVLLPWLVFYIRKKLSPKLNRRIAILFGLGAVQGFLGWYMVQSGLVDKPYVSHYRLAAHLSLAYVVLGLTFWTILCLKTSLRTRVGAQKADTNTVAPPWLRMFAHSLALLVCLQLFYGALMSGLKAGLGNNTFPTMSGQWFPSGFAVLQPFMRNFIDNNVAVQFIHRTLGWLMIFGSVTFWYAAQSCSLNRFQNISSIALLVSVALQFLLGVLTLIYVMPLGLAIAHQIGAMLVFLSIILVMYSLKQNGPHAA